MESHTSTSTSTTEKKVSQIFCANEKADTTFKSCDGVLFYVERKYIEWKSSGFPPPEFETCQDVVPLTETAEVLELLFLFLYPKRPPTLEGLPFEVLDAFTEAVEKYEVFSGLAICEVYMRKAMDSHPIQVLTYAAKHDHPQTMQDACVIGNQRDPWAVLNCGLKYGIDELMNTAAETALGTPIERVPDVLDPTRLGAWMRYYAQWFNLWKEICKPISWSPHHAQTHTERSSFGTYIRIQEALLCGGPKCLLDLDDIFVCAGTEKLEFINLVEAKKAWVADRMRNLLPFSEFL